MNKEELPDEITSPITGDILTKQPILSLDNGDDPDEMIYAMNGPDFHCEFAIYKNGDEEIFVPFED